MRHIQTLILCISFCITSPSVVRADTDEIAGQMIADLAGEEYSLPMLRSHLQVSLQGDMATVEVRQTFLNEAHLPMEAEYLFPLNQHAAIYSMEMVVGDETVVAVMQEKAEAVATFETAAREGKAAALLTQHRPNMFTQRLANLMPGLPVEVTLRYVQMVPKIEGQYELVIPTVVGPRYTGSTQIEDLIDEYDSSDEGADIIPAANTWTVSELPAYPPVAGLTLPETFTPERLSFDLQMTGGLTIREFGSATHPLTVDRTEDGLKASFANGQELDNRDLVIRYMLGGDTLEAASLSHTDARGGFLSLMVEPPELTPDTMIRPRELVFVLDTSESMGGEPMAASKTFMDSALRGLRGTDFFRIIPFSNTTQSFSSDAQRASPQNIQKARQYVGNLSAGGGTEIDHAIRTAFETPQPQDTMRIVVFLSDGYIGNEARVLRTIHNKIGDARIYSFGVGNSVNRYLLDAMADEGRGYARYVPVGEDAIEVAQALAADLKTPVLTDISIDWGDLDVRDVSPAKIPDLFAGTSLRIFARHNASGPATVTLRGLVQGRAAEMPVTLELTEDAERAALPLIWARNRIATLTRDIAVGKDPKRADAEITKLGLEFSLQTKNTSFVAVSKRIVNESGEPAETVQVALPMPAGVPATAYPNGGFSGSSTPEPQAILGFLMLAAMTLVGLRRRVR